MYTVVKNPFSFIVTSGLRTSKTQIKSKGILEVFSGQAFHYRHGSLEACNHRKRDTCAHKFSSPLRLSVKIFPQCLSRVGPKVLKSGVHHCVKVAPAQMRSQTLTISSSNRGSFLSS
ncbi:hypothetical protein TNCV_244411 [Trichonephila clavipes]|uniref:Uncharacterized protein n=1 Tax=Trichonephila clavipes TaxID=2585209 RepID=A0A8X6RPY2_TRICX|nr:hypothetical protein TNCV_244411 [Trichonephila clavipes]